MLNSPIYKLRESCQQPEQLLFPRDAPLELNAAYYIHKRILSSLDRVRLGSHPCPNPARDLPHP